MELLTVQLHFCKNWVEEESKLFEEKMLLL
jgi:hypothetical protein